MTATKDDGEPGNDTGDTTGPDAAAAPVRREPWRTVGTPRVRRGQRLWVWPTVMVAVAVLLSAALPVVDALVPQSFKSEVSIPRDPGVTASRLGAVAGGTISFTGFVFTIVMLTVQFGTSSLSARLIPFFQRDRVVRLALGVFPATFVYTVLIAIEIGADNNREFPSISVGFATFLSVVSVLVFLLLVQRIADMMRPPRLFRQVTIAAEGAVRRFHGSGADGSPDGLAAPPDGVVHNGTDFGTLTGVDVRGLRRFAARHRVGITVVPRLGDFVYPGAPLCRIHGTATRIRGDAVARRLRIGEERRLRHDPAFCLLVLSNVAVKAMSAAVNDPTTAVQAMDHIETLLVRLVAARPGPVVYTAGAGRVAVGAPDWPGYLAIGTDELRHCAASSPEASRRLHLLLTRVETVAPPEYRQAARERIDALHRQGGHVWTELDAAHVAAPDTRFDGPFGSGG
ncbi:putative membrane protein [Stackebrandtia albiflava]|uniref:Putative membrane protein n=1 Tax=Stackebrandtia albiflava TaxID=406432 RepID=A0A562VGY4_9ACTN|nr:DUF2254 family protein [Stackebrandtia albiflava]TWJ17130.1 putative membrane protein [Stackebrandtia albiflava]